jgi:prepilin-type N-terminal cleavage/methylation domain-containing protein
MKNDRGFSLLELLIVVAIILIIATIAIPSLLRSRQAAQESSAVAQIRTINIAEVTYLSSNQGNYGDIASLIAQGLLDTRFAPPGIVSGYVYTLTASGADYTVTAMPTSPNSGRYAYFSSPDAVIRYSTSATGCGGPGGACFPGNQSGAPVS